VTQQDLFGDVSPSPQPGPPASAQRYSWFFAVRPGEADAARIDTLADALLASHGVAGYRVGAARLHITLEEVAPELVDAACRAADTVRLPAFDVRFDTAMTFGSGGPFVLLGAKETDGLDALRELRTVLGCAMADRGFRPQRSFEPHMTLCYDSRSRVARVAIEPVTFRATEFALVKSHLGQSRHEVLRTWPLVG